MMNCWDSAPRCNSIPLHGCEFTLKKHPPTVLSSLVGYWLQVMLVGHWLGIFDREVVERNSKFLHDLQCNSMLAQAGGA